jgi:hypothetical protein
MRQKLVHLGLTGLVATFGTVSGVGASSALAATPQLAIHCPVGTLSLENLSTLGTGGSGQLALRFDDGCTFTDPSTHTETFGPLVFQITPANYTFSPSCTYLGGVLGSISASPAWYSGGGVTLGAGPPALATTAETGTGTFSTLLTAGGGLLSGTVYSNATGTTGSATAELVPASGTCNDTMMSYEVVGFTATV